VTVPQGVLLEGRRGDGQHKIVSWVIVTQEDFHVLQMSREYQFHCPRHLREILCRVLFRRPAGWFLIEPSALSVTQKHFHGLALLPCPSMFFVVLGGASEVYRCTACIILTQEHPKHNPH
jgi:hypothetical protein